MEIRNMFFNTPVRRRFLKKPQTEQGHTTESFIRLALANPGQENGSGLDGTAAWYVRTWLTR
ncbi:MAG: hypothetical protein AAFP90_10260, partial [Planctomycetota bacterium]